MAQTIATFDTAHAGTLHDAQLDYYGKRLATASSDHTVRVWDVSSDQPQFLAELKGHEGPVWNACWAHPKFGNMLATCSYDKKVIVWREQRPQDWQIIYRCEQHTGSVNGVSFSPWEFGLHLASASSDGTVIVHSRKPDNTWSTKSFSAHVNGVNAVCWAPVAATPVLGGVASAPAASGAGAQRIVTGGCDNQVRVWRFDESSNKWDSMPLPNYHTDWVRDVAWRPNAGLTSSTIASCSEDGRVVIWNQDSELKPWHPSVLDPKMEHESKKEQKLDAVWRVSWSVTGTVLAVASGDNHITLYKETVDGKWEKVTNLSEDSLE